MADLVSGGIGNLRNPRVDGGGPKRAIPADDEAAIKSTRTAGQEGVQAGAEGGQPNPEFAPGSHRGNIPMGVGDLMSPPGWNVP